MSEDSADHLSLETPEQAAAQLGQLTAKEREVLDLLTEHLTTKLIARKLGTHPNTIDRRVSRVRERWETVDRNDTVRRYKELLAVCGKTTHASEVVDSRPVEMEQVDDPVSDVDMILTADPTLDIVDRGQTSPFAAERPVAMQALDVKLGKLGRLGLVLIFGMGVAITFAAMLAISDALGRLL